MESPPQQKPSGPPEGSGPRSRRQLHDHRKNTCPLLLVADYRFFMHMGRGEESTTLNYLVRPPPRLSNTPTPTECRPASVCFQIELIDRVDDIYRNTSWDEEFSGYGVQIQQVGGGVVLTGKPGWAPTVLTCSCDHMC